MKDELIQKVKELIEKGYSFARVKKELGISSTSMVHFYWSKANGKLRTRAELVEENEELREKLKKVEVEDVIYEMLSKITKRGK